ncbi:hypothetical protein ZIOFF_069650 [Zingiber officinale]|uniref:Uncharacterized protein n=1 Tax=Zingiber officinale TaxID=94328 RepID=A0A8J5ERW2_ZINOF|nr:hypothetical protein ZIOFF_069650 [Zingiber officinale]
MQYDRITVRVTTCRSSVPMGWNPTQWRNEAEALPGDKFAEGYTCRSQKEKKRSSFASPELRANDLTILKSVGVVQKSRGSVGPVIAVLAVIAVLGVIAGLVGRLCSGRTVMGYGHYDLEGWFERKCASCIDGRLAASAPPPRPSANGTDAQPPPPEAPQQAKQTERRADASTEATES